MGCIEQQLVTNSFKYVGISFRELDVPGFGDRVGIFFF